MENKIVNYKEAFKGNTLGAAAISGKKDLFEAELEKANGKPRVLRKAILQLCAKYGLKKTELLFSNEDIVFTSDDPKKLSAGAVWVEAVSKMTAKRRLGMFVTLVTEYVDLDIAKTRRGFAGRRD